MKFQLVWARRSQQNMSALFKYISEDSPQNAGKVVEDIMAAAEKGIANPEIYPPDKNKKVNDGSYRAFEIRRYRIVYRVTKDIVRVLKSKAYEKRT